MTNTHEHHEPAEVFEVLNPDGAGPALILCEHASCRMLPQFGDLGLDAGAGTSHAAWDPGARGVAVLLAKSLNSPMVAGTVSRLVYDCNRPPDVASAMPETSELIKVPGNIGLTADQRQARVQTVYDPFCVAVSDVIAARKTHGLATSLITIHSFTPVYYGNERPTEIGILHDEDTRLADAMLAEAGQFPSRRIDRNMPYGPEDGVTHSLKLHGIENGLPNVMIEVRNDLLADASDEAVIAEILTAMLLPALTGSMLVSEGQNHA